MILTGTSGQATSDKDSVYLKNGINPTAASWPGQP